MILWVRQLQMGKQKQRKCSRRRRKRTRRSRLRLRRVTKCPMDRPLYTNLASLKRDKGLRVSA
jgi:hypothetical protein